MTRYVVSTDQVAHLWANRSQDSARNAKRTFYFEGATIYSYGRHFPIARHETDAQGRACVLFTTRDYSVTTSRHLHNVRAALRGLPLTVYETPHVEEGRGAADTLRAYRSRAVAEIAKAKKAQRHNRAYRWERADALFAEGNAFAEAFGLTERLAHDPADVERRERDLAGHAEALRAHSARPPQRFAFGRRTYASRHWVAPEERAARAADWLAGGNVSFPYEAHDFRGSEALARLRVRGDDLQTSRGAIVALEEARKLFPRIAQVRACGRPVSLENCALQPRIGGFPLREITAEGDIRVGCHFIPWSEIERVAQQIGALPAEASANV